ncbi:hypothetical protein PPYR_13808 [Photinus pyralis]|uniref:Uncharacterized protein n=1 Tax=Photinus pyralis TaxID=7054 RepID=A0A5N4AAA9_PHOPY|nr:centromere-associated protein E-like isoform X2 [Photinus pyralis]KAB0794188.1 hypothetical protein PPYR_13808 [Photinus pyralis]
MVQENDMESRLGPLDVVLYAAILCVHYPLRIFLASYRLIKATIVKAAAIPRQILGYVTVSLTIVLESSEKKIIDILNLLASLPSYLLGKLSFSRKSAELNSQTETKQESDLTSYTEIVLSAVKRTSDAIYGFLVACANFWRHIILLPLKLSLIPLKAVKNLTETLLNIPSEPKTEMDRPHQQSVMSHCVDYLFIVLANFQFYLIYAIAIIEKLMTQLSSLFISTPRHLFHALQLLYLRCLQLLAVSVVFVYNTVRYTFFYIVLLVNRAVKKPPRGTLENGTDRETLIEENSKLREELIRAKTNNDNQKCEQQIKDLEGQLNEVQVAFGKEREEYQREIEKLKQSTHPTEFNTERTKLQGEIQRLQALIAEVRRESEEEGRLKKKEAVDLDNERNQLQERIQNLQQQVVSLQKQNEAMASSYSESRKQMQAEFDKERKDLLREIEILQRNLEEMKEAQSEAQYRYVLLLGENQTIQEHMRALQDSLEKLKMSNAKQEQPEPTTTASFSVTNKTSANFSYETTSPSDNGGAYFQNTIDEVINHLDQLHHSNHERSMLHAEVEKLQALVEDMQKQNEERDNIDNERKRLQTVQEQVAELQNQNMVMALSYTEARKLMEVKFEGEREELLYQVQRLLSKVEGKEDNPKQEFHLHDNNDANTCINRLDDLCHVCRNIERELVRFTETCQNLSNLHYQQNAIGEVEKVLNGFADRLLAEVPAEKPKEDDELRKQMHTLQTQLNEVLQKGKQNFEALEERNRVIDVNMIVVKSQIDRIHDSLYGLKAHLEMRDEKLDRLRACHTRAVRVLKDERSKVTTLLSQIDSMEKSIEDAEDDKLVLQTTRSENEMKINGLERENSELKQNLRNLQAQIEEIERERKHEEKLHNAVITELERGLEHVQKTSEMQLITVDRENSALQQKLLQLQARTDEIERERKHDEKLHKAVVTELEREMERLRSENETNVKTLERENLELKHDVKLHLATITELEREMEHLQTENYHKTQKLSEKIKELQTDKLHERDEMINRLRMHHERAIKEFHEEKLELTNLRAQVEAMEKSMESAHEEKLNYQAALTESNLKVGRLAHDNCELKQTLNELRMQMEDAERHYEEMQKHDEKLHDAVVVELHREIEDIETDRDQKVQKLAEKIQELQTERIILLDQNMDLQGVVEFLNKEVEKWKKAKKPFFSSK